MTDNIYLELTRQFNAKRLRCIVSSGQAVVLHRLAVVSKDGDWIVREDEEALAHILDVLERRGARYRLGAPLHTRWMAGGWSSHFEFNAASDAASPLRVRTDFVTRPPRLTPDDLARLWHEQEAASQHSDAVPVVDVRRLVELKKTNRERDYAVIGELARRLDISDVPARLLLSRSARDLQELAAQYPQQALHLASQRPLLGQATAGREALETALDAERRALIRANEERLSIYVEAAQQWYLAWPGLERAIAGLPLSAAHALLVENARMLLPPAPMARAATEAAKEEDE